MPQILCLIHSRHSLYIFWRNAMIINTSSQYGLGYAVVTKNSEISVASVQQKDIFFFFFSPQALMWVGRGSSSSGEVRPFKLWDYCLNNWLPDSSQQRKEKMRDSFTLRCLGMRMAHHLLSHFCVPDAIRWPWPNSRGVWEMQEPHEYSVGTMDLCWPWIFGNSEM